MVFLEIISISIDEETLSELNEIQRALGFKSRSKMLRSTIDLLLGEYRALESLNGRHEVVFIITYRDKEKNHVSNILHKFENEVKVTVHQHRGTMCLDTLNIDADSEVIKRLFKEMKGSKCIRSLNFALLGHY
ncbi:MAG: ribbon-helix-helix protein, CopG family [Candidatus Micrarchaeota archaeon]|nr:ribbon-helix-helix protein, CopG family [Candidatus Micrarchaeota archaeon]MDE1858990.1 ribbon-helix-helix protein, CopG family [Candidatus Micrarchaeota archaeon]